jgi:DNA-directed RNA polymerase subunit RPC12/RpoP
MTYGEPNAMCQECGYQWMTRSKLRKITCPSCSSKVENPTVKKTERFVTKVGSEELIPTPSA